MWPQTPEGLPTPPPSSPTLCPDVPNPTAHLLLRVTPFSLHGRHGHVAVDALGPSDGHQTPPLLLV